MNEKGFPLTQYDEGKTTFDRLVEAQERAVALSRKTKPGPNEPPIVFRFQREKMAREAWRKQYGEEEQKKKLDAQRAGLDAERAKLDAQKSISKDKLGPDNENA